MIDDAKDVLSIGNVTLTIKDMIIRPWSGLIDLIRLLESFLLDHRMPPTLQ
jgi:hypothetical protein